MYRALGWKDQEEVTVTFDELPRNIAIDRRDDGKRYATWGRCNVALRRIILSPENILLTVDREQLHGQLLETLGHELGHYQAYTHERGLGGILERHGWPLLCAINIAALASLVGIIGGLTHFVMQIYHWTVVGQFPAYSKFLVTLATALASIGLGSYAIVKGCNAGIKASEALKKYREGRADRFADELLATHGALLAECITVQRTLFPEVAAGPKEESRNG